jgi:Fe2+ transport system protein FeoA
MFSWHQQKCIKPIYYLQEGEKGQIVLIRGTAAEHRCLCILGITVGQSITVQRVDVTPRGHIITVKAGDIELILDKYLANNIQVEVPIAVEEKIPLNLQKEYVKLT